MHLSGSFLKRIRNGIASSPIMDHTISKIFFTAFWAMLVSKFSVGISKVIDGLMISNFLHTEGYIGYSLIMPVFSMLSTIGALIATGTQLTVSRLIGRGEFEEADSVFTYAMLVCLGLSALATGLGIAFSGRIVSFLGVTPQEPELYENACDYWIGLATGIIPLALNSILLPVININGDKARTRFNLLFLMTVNVLLNCLSIFVFKWGMLGVGLATSISLWCCFINYMMHFRNKKIICRFRLRNIRVRKLFGVFALGLPKATTRICGVLHALTANRWLLIISSGSAVAAAGIYKDIASLFFIPLTAVSQAVTLISGVFFGERDGSSLKSATTISLLFSVGIGSVIAVVLIVFAPYLVAVFIAPGNIIHMQAVQCLRWHAVAIPFYAVNTHFVSFMLGSGRHKQVHMYTVFEQLIYSILCTLILGLLFGTEGVFAAFCIAEILFFIHIVITVWIHNRAFPRSISDFMMLPEEFDISPDMVHEFSVHNMQEVTSVSVQVYDFCKERKIDQRRTYFTALCAEELAANIVTYGFSDGKKHSIRVRVSYKNDNLTLRIRDDCRLFDIREKYDSINPKDVTANIGIRLVMNMTMDVSYVNTLHVNTTTIRV